MLHMALWRPTIEPVRKFLLGCRAFLQLQILATLVLALFDRPVMRHEFLQMRLLPIKCMPQFPRIF
jgi:hypothetical protein